MNDVISGNHSLPIQSPLFNQKPMFQRLAEQGEGGDFASALEAAKDGKQESAFPTIEEAARQMEVMVTTVMLKTMEETSTEGGLLGSKSQGLGYFKDLFLQQVAEDMVDKQGFGFREALVSTYETKNLGS